MLLNVRSSKRQVHAKFADKCTFKLADEKRNSASMAIHIPSNDERQMKLVGYSVWQPSSRGQVRSEKENSGLTLGVIQPRSQYLRNPNAPTFEERSVIMTANGTTRTTEGATVHVCDLEMFVQVRLLKESPAVLSLGKLCEEVGCSHEWHPGQPSYLMKKWESHRM